MQKIFTHGSEDSLDHDVYAIFEEIPTFKEAKEYCNSLSPEMNANILVIKDGVVSWCFKGTVDECNNSLFRTYELHEQEHELPIMELITRDYEDKIVRTVRGLLSYFSRTELRLDIKKALRTTSFEEKMTTLRQCILSRDIDFKKTSHIELFKFYAFQIGQTRALVEDDIELFSKSQVAAHYPSVKDHLYRKTDSDELSIQAFFIDFLDFLEERVFVVDEGYQLQGRHKTFSFSEAQKFKKLQ